MKKNAKIFVKHLFIIIIILTCIPGVVSKAKTLKINYDNNDINYTGQQVKYLLNNKRIDKNGYPGIIINGTSLVSAYDVFTSKAINAKYTYTPKTKEIIIKKDDITVKMKINSNKAYINNKEYNISQAPRIVKFISKKTNRVLVPARFVSEALGYNYTYSSKDALVVLKAPLRIYYDKKWHTCKDMKKVTVDGKNIDVTRMPSIVSNSTTLVQANKVFKESLIKADYKYNSSKKTIVIKKGKNKIEMKIGSKIAKVNGKTKNLTASPKIAKNGDTNKSYVMVPASFTAKSLGYNYSYNTRNKTSIISTIKLTPKPDDREDDKDSTGKEDITHELDKNYKNEIDNILKNSQDTISSNNENVYTLNTIEKVDLDKNSKKEVYQIQSQDKFGEIKSSYMGDNNLVLEIKNGVSSNTTNTYENSIVNTITTFFDETENKTIINLTTEESCPRYTISLSKDKKTLSLTIYYNYLTKIYTQNDESTESINMDFIANAKPIITQDQTNVYIELPYTINTLEKKNINFKGNFIKNIELDNDDKNVTVIKINKSENSKYNLYENDNNLKLTFYDTVIANAKIQIPLPKDIDYSEITDEDLYLKNQFKIIIPGNQLEFYKNNPILCTSKIVTNVNTTLNSFADTVITFSTSKIQGYRLSVKNKCINIQIDDPKKIYKNIVVLDPGHGGKDNGTSNKGTLEKDLNYKILYMYAKEYFNAPDSQIKAYYTKTTNEYVKLLNRANFAKKVDADLFISLHMNAGDASSKTAKGTEVYYSENNNKTLANGLTSSKMASVFVNNLTTNLGTSNRGAKAARYAVINKNTVPAILIELGFLSNANDYELLTSTDFQKRAAKEIYDSTCEIFSEYESIR